MSIKDNLKKLKSELPPHVTLVAVSKTKPHEAVMEAYECGQRDFGENYVQELTEKYDALPKDIRWHFIGHLQSNKVKFIAPFVYLIHGVDSLKLLQEINKQGEKNKRIIPCLLQLYIAREETKFGLSFEECEALLHSDLFKNLTSIQIKGFMAMASNTDNQTQVEREFLSLKTFANKISSENFPIEILSFGMSGDYSLAIRCGSTLVRIGSSIFGERRYT
ncbi:MAG: YggS family pyridoxal phosphate-dependent enzyme [bacterium]|nr:YggS family pyridoxal phosphate-dependent enzyme [bacterium]